jgi:GNAT superfamily N-acetyltransferase
VASSREESPTLRASTRPATNADEGFLRQMVYGALYVPPGHPPFPVSVLDQPDVSHYYRGFGRRAGDVGRIAETRGGEPVGAAWVRHFTSADPGYGYVDDDTPELTIAVLPAHRGQGLGTTLLLDVFAGAPRSSLSVDRRNPARRLYERLGFEVVAANGDTLTMLRRASTAQADVLAAITDPPLYWGPGGMRPAGIAAIGRDILDRARRRIVELGSGASTVLLARLLTRWQPDGDWRLAAVEHDVDWVRRVTEELADGGIGDRVTVIHAPLVDHHLAQDGLLWYDERALVTGLDQALDGELIDLLVVDGPPAFAPGFGLARYPALPVLRSRLASGAAVVLDDVDRPGEQEVLRRWERETGVAFDRLGDEARLARSSVSEG